MSSNQGAYKRTFSSATPVQISAAAEANNEKELWNVANDVLNPKKANNWNIIDEEGIHSFECMPHH